MSRAKRTVVLLGAAFVGTFVGGCGEQAPETVPERAVPSPGAGAHERTELPPLVARVDAEGFFEIEDPSVTEAYSASPSVRAPVGRLGRLEPRDADDARVGVRLADGSFETRRLDRHPATEPLRERVLTALRSLAATWAADGTSRGYARLLTGETGPPPGTVSARHSLRRYKDWRPVLPRLGRADPGSPVPSSPGVPLEEWAPAERPFVRFRSVEAAYRFTSEADRLAARLLAAQGDGRDWGTLRWALYDLLLPTIWRTNPQGERGVGECAVVLGSPDIRGRGEVAVLLRITDPGLHRMQVLAGIGQEAEPDHLWRPKRDPFPWMRERRNFRETRIDVEWVGTGEESMEALGASGVRRLASDPAWLLVRGASPPPRDEAFLLCVPDAVRSRRGERLDFERDPAKRARREENGLRALGQGWIGADPLANGGGDVLGVAPQATPLLLSLVSARATTDVHGALVEATFEDDASARAAEEVLAAAARPFEGGAAVCRTNLRDLVPLAVCESVPATDVAERSFVVLGWRPVCPCGGTYLVHPVTRETSCSLHGSVRKPLPEPPAPGPLLRDLTRDGATVRFRWPIDWDRRE